MGKWILRFVTIGYVSALVVVPLFMIVARAFSNGASQVLQSLMSSQALHAMMMSLLVASIAVPLTVVFGVGTGLLLARHKNRMGTFLNVFIDLPFAMSPVVIGLSLYLMYGSAGWLGAHLETVGITVLFSLPAMVMATAVVCLPFVVREIVPVLKEIGTEQEQAAQLLGAGPWRVFLRITLPSLRWAITYGVVLASARALGEFGAVTIVSGNVIGQTQTLPLFVEERFSNFDSVAAYSASLLLGVLSLLILFAMSLLAKNRQPR